MQNNQPAAFPREGNQAFPDRFLQLVMYVHQDGSRFLTTR